MADVASGNFFYKISIPVHFGSEKKSDDIYVLVLAFFLSFLISFFVHNLLLWSIKPLCSTSLMICGGWTGRV